MYENRTMKPVEFVPRMGSDRGDEFVWGILYAHMETSQ
jgi:hypothetical protein